MNENDTSVNAMTRLRKRTNKMERIAMTHTSATGATLDNDSTGALPVTDLRKTDISQLIPPQGPRRQPLAGFDADYIDIVDYILRCTLKIWEEKNIGLIYSHYLHNSVVHSGDGIIYGREEIVADTIKTLAAFPNDHHFAQDVIWTGNERDGFYSSHRFLSVGRNTGPTIYGPANNAQSVRGGIALCYVRDNRIIEEWIARMDANNIRSMGYDLDDVVAMLAEQDLANPRAPEVHGEIERAVGQQAPVDYPVQQTTGFAIDYHIRRTMHQIWNMRMLGEIARAYAPNYLFHGVREAYGRGEYTEWVLCMLAAFPDAQLMIDHLYWMDDGDGNYRTSMRWSLLGTHSGHGIFGKPTGVRCRVWGLTQHYIRDGQFVEEYTYFNELALLKRLYLARCGKL